MYTLTLQNLGLGIYIQQIAHALNEIKYQKSIPAIPFVSFKLIL